VDFSCFFSHSHNLQFAADSGSVVHWTGRAGGKGQTRQAAPSAVQVGYLPGTRPTESHHMLSNMLMPCRLAFVGVPGMPSLTICRAVCEMA